MNAVGTYASQGQRAIGDRVPGAMAVRFHAHRVNAAVGPRPARDLVQTFIDVFLVEIYGFPRLPAPLRPGVRDAVYGHDMARTLKQGAADAELTNRAAAHTATVSPSWILA